MAIALKLERQHTLTEVPTNRQNGHLSIVEGAPRSRFMRLAKLYMDGLIEEGIVPVNDEPVTITRLDVVMAAVGIYSNGIELTCRTAVTAFEIATGRPPSLKKLAVRGSLTLIPGAELLAKWGLAKTLGYPVRFEGKK